MINETNRIDKSQFRGAQFIPSNENRSTTKKPINMFIHTSLIIRINVTINLAIKMTVILKCTSLWLQIAIKSPFNRKIHRFFLFIGMENQINISINGS